MFLLKSNINFIIRPLAVVSMIIAILALSQDVLADDIGFDITSNESGQISDSPFLHLSNDKLNWPPIIPPEIKQINDIEKIMETKSIDFYNVATKEVTRIPDKELVQSDELLPNSEVPTYRGLFPSNTDLEAVFPPDDRVRITPTTGYPWRTICKLYITFPDGSRWIGSGSIIGRGDGNGFHIYTAAHCVYDSSHGGWVSNLEVIPGLDGTYMPFNHAYATGVYIYSTWVDYGVDDWAVVTLDRRVGNYTGWLGRKTAEPSDPIYTGILNAAGYPADLSSGLGLYHDKDYGRIASEYYLWHYIDTYGGQSGCPVYTDTFDIVAIHDGYDGGSDSNYSTRLNQDKFDRTITWINSDPLPNDRADLIDDGQAYSGFSPTTIDDGSSFHAWCDVRNIGTAASGSFDVSFYASIDTIITTGDYLVGTASVSSISPFTRDDCDWSGNFPDIPSGTYYVGWIIDSGSNVTEFDEVNNTAYKTGYQLNVVNVEPDIVTIDTLPSGIPNPVASGGTVNCSASATDSLGHTISYSWTSTGGSFVNANVQNPVWNAPANTGNSIANYALTVTATCSEGKTDIESYQQGVLPEITIALYSGWNGVSCPGEPLVSDWSTVIAGNPDIALVVEYDTTQKEFVIATTIEFGKSYFIGATNNTQITLGYNPRNSLSLPVKAGWNPLGSLSGSVPIGNVISDPSGQVSLIVCWDNANKTWDQDVSQFEIVSTIEPGVGYIAGCLGDCNLNMSCLPSAPPTLQRFVAERSWESTLSVKTQSDHKELVFGMNGSASDEMDLYDRPTPPMLEISDINAGWVIEDSCFDLFDRSYVKEDTDASWELSVELTEDGEINWNNLPQSYSFTLSYDGIAVDMHRENSLSLPIGKHALLVSVSPKVVIPDKTSLLASYPNPCNPETWIPYELSEETDVRIMIYSSAGNLVRSLDLGHRPSGSYTDRSKAAYWDGRNESGEKVSSGIYFYTLITPEFSQVRKLLIVR